MLHYKIFENKSTNEYVTFIHGAGGSSNIWFKQIKAFQQKYNVLLIDLRGHGESKLSFSKKLKRYNFKIVGNDIIEVLDHLKIKCSHFVGISLGTIIIREVAERFPNRVTSMVLGGAILKMNLRGQVLMRLGTLFKSIVPYILLYKLFAFVILPKKNHKNSREIFVNEAKKLEQREFKKWFALVAEVNPLLKLFRLKEIQLPTLYIMGDEDYMFLSPVKKVVQAHKSSTLSIIENCGHVVNIDQAQIFNQRALQFILSLVK